MLTPTQSGWSHGANSRDYPSVLPNTWCCPARQGSGSQGRLVGLGPGHLGPPSRGVDAAVGTCEALKFVAKALDFTWELHLRSEFWLIWLQSRWNGEESTSQCMRHKRCKFNPWVGKIPWRRKWQPTPVFSPGRILDRGAWWSTVQRVTESDMTEVT